MLNKHINTRCAMSTNVAEVAIREKQLSFGGQELINAFYIAYMKICFILWATQFKNNIWKLIKLGDNINKKCKVEWLVRGAKIKENHCNLSRSRHKCYQLSHLYAKWLWHQFMESEAGRRQVSSSSRIWCSHLAGFILLFRLNYP